MKKQLGNARQLGVSMVEVLVATAVGLFLMAGIIQLMVSSKQSYRGEEQLARLQDNARYALSVMSRDLRQAGYMGCRTLSKEVDINFVAEDAWVAAANMAGAVASVSSPYIKAGFPYPVFGYDDDGSNPSAAGTWDEYVAAQSLTGAGVTRVDGTDVIQMSMATGMGASLSADMAAPASVVKIDANANTDGLGTGDQVVLTDCQSVDVFTVTGATTDEEDATVSLAHAITGNANHSTSLSYAYKGGSRLFPFTTRAYFVGKIGDGNPALYQLDFGGNAREIIENLEDLELEYGEDTNGDFSVDRYRAAAEAIDWDNVISVRIHLLLRSEDNVAVKARTIKFPVGSTDADNSVGGGDKRLRLAFTQTLALRNRLQ